MKRYYTVKEASKLLGLSTNTIYEYLKQGKLVSRRIGRGRFKISYASLAPFIDSTVSFNNANIESGFAASAYLGQAAEAASQNGNNSQQVKNTFYNHDEGRSKKLQPSKFNKPGKTDRLNKNEAEFTPESKYSGTTDYLKSGYPDISINLNDIVFYRLFKALTLIGVGIIYLFTGLENRFPFNIFGAGIDGFLLKLLPFVLIISGFLTLAGVLYYHKLKSFQDRIHVVTALTLGYYSFLAAISQDYGLLVFTGSLLAVTIAHLFSDIKGNDNFTFVSQYLRYSLFLVLLGGIVIIFYPGYFPFEKASLLIEENKGFTGMIWYGTLIPILIVLKRNSGKPTALLASYFIVGGLVTIILATRLTFNERWDSSYLSLMTGLFSLLLAAWHILNFKIVIARLYILVVAFAWISSSLLFGLFAIEYSHEQLKEQYTTTMIKNLERTVIHINSSFEQQSALLIATASKSEIRSAVLTGNQSVAMQEAMEIFDKVDVSQRVLIYNSEGVAIAVYPHTSIGLGTNYSSREYFQKTKSTYKGQVSNVFENVLGTFTVMQTEPVFDDNNFIGMIGLALSLDKLSSKYQLELDGEANMVAVDENGVVAFATNREIIGTTVQKDELINNINSAGKLGVTQAVRKPGWDIYINTPTASLLANVSNLNMLVVLLVVVNAIITTGTALVLVTRSKYSGGANYAPIPLSIAKTY